ncbi:hypothetical protein JRO89_XS11G0049900 [Xanthoceras sorbifolium]|uniref:Uncharacterized protein n=1 Tax=Xanthoceras sorbifolium TaxID=99658 RepID=A0ABQ8HER4_9ROSI|nr:hypothetical protein JRO89_XS11G0049900 [Xanthoceras sorbifolium]
MVIAFFWAINTKMEAPFEQILDQLDLPVTIVITDVGLSWAIDTANRRNIPVAAIWTTSTLLLSFSYHFDLFTEKRITIDLEDHGDDIVDFIPGISSIRVADLPLVFMKNDQKSSMHVLPFKLEVSKLQYLLSSSIYEQDLDYIEWLNSQPANSVSYISMGTRDDSSRLKDCCGDLGLMVPCKLIVEDWKIGWRLKKEVGAEKIVTREAIVKTIQTFMDMNTNMRKELIKRAKQVQEIFQAAIASGGSSDTDLNAFINDITQGNDLLSGLRFHYIYIMKS